MASATLSVIDTFPAGTVVGAYKRGLVAEGIPHGVPDETATVATDGTLVFSALTAGVGYVAYSAAVGRQVSFTPAGEPVFSGAIFNGAAPPSESLGEDGDLYVRTVGPALYGPKDGAWGSSVSLVGPQGAAGDGGMVFNVKNPAYGAVGDGVADDTDAITLALEAADAASGDVIVYFPHGVYLDSAQRDFSESANLVIQGPGSPIVPYETVNYGGHIACEWRYTGTAGPFINAASSDGLRIQGVAITYSSAAFTGDLIDARTSRYLTVRDFYLGGSPSNPLAVNARTPLLLADVAWADLDNGSFARAQNGIWGIDPAIGAGYSNAATFKSVTFSDLPKTARNPGRQWSFHGCIFEGSAGTGVSSRSAPFVVDAGAGGFEALSIFGCGFWDINEAGGGPWIQSAVSAKGISVVGCLIGAHVDDGPFFDLTSPSWGIVFTGNYAGNSDDGVNYVPLIRVSGGDDLGVVRGRHVAGNRLLHYVANGDQPPKTTAYNDDAAYTLRLKDIEHNIHAQYGGGPITITVPPQSSVRWPGGTEIRILAGSQPVTIAAGAGVTLQDPRALNPIPARGSALLINVHPGGGVLDGTDEWYVA